MARAAEMSTITAGISPGLAAMFSTGMGAPVTLRAAAMMSFTVGRRWREIGIRVDDADEVGYRRHVTIRSDRCLDGSFIATTLPR